MPYYHGTHVDKLDSILRHGLGGIASSRNFPESDRGIYLATEPEICLAVLIDHYLQTGGPETKPSQVLDSFRVIVIDDSRVDLTKMSKDPHLRIEGAYLYLGVIDVTGMPILTSDDIVQD